MMVVGSSSLEYSLGSAEVTTWHGLGMVKGGKQVWVETECWVRPGGSPSSSHFVLDKHASATVLLPEKEREKPKIVTMILSRRTLYQRTGSGSHSNSVCAPADARWGQELKRLSTL